jgi:uncharacterized iron-regulated membrane protein
MSSLDVQPKPRGLNMLAVRRWHNYLSIFFAPAILFFAFSGLLQVVGLHEARGSTTYHPPAWIVTLASIHKDQVLPDNHDDHDGHDTDHHEGSPQHHGEQAFGPLKIFASALALGLIFTTLLGITIALRNPVMRRTSLILLAAGMLLPVALIVA